MTVLTNSHLSKNLYLRRFWPDPKFHQSPLRQQGSRKGPDRRLGSRFPGNDGRKTSGGKYYRASWNLTFFSRLALKRHDGFCGSRNPSCHRRRLIWPQRPFIDSLPGKGPGRRITKLLTFSPYCCIRIQGP